MQAASDEGYNKGKLDEARGQRRLLKYISTIYRDWQTSSAEKEEITIIQLLKWKMRQEYERGLKNASKYCKLELTKETSDGTTIPITEEGPDVQADTREGSGPTRSNSQETDGGSSITTKNHKRNHKRRKRKR
jgi:hypothetical protein